MPYSEASDDDFGNFVVDEAALEEIEKLEAIASASSKVTTPRRQQARRPSNEATHPHQEPVQQHQHQQKLPRKSNLGALDSSPEARPSRPSLLRQDPTSEAYDDFDSFMVDAAALEDIERIEAIASARNQGALNRMASLPPRATATTNSHFKRQLSPRQQPPNNPFIQHNLCQQPQQQKKAAEVIDLVDSGDEFSDVEFSVEKLGEIDNLAKCAPNTQAPKANHPIFNPQRSTAGLSRNTPIELDPFEPPKTQGLVKKPGKAWNRTAFAGTGRLKNKGRDFDESEEDDFDDDQDCAFEQFPIGFVDPKKSLPPLKHKCDEDAIKSWIYPINLPKRDYQYNIVRRCLFQNTLVALPTGLGKTFIAGVLMLNYSRWFPTGKIFFIAPTKPLVNQQASAFPETCGFLHSQVCTLVGDVNKDIRMKMYPKKTVFFMTAQTLYNDLEKGRLDPTEVMLLVVDEAHRATGRHAYAQVVRFLQSRNHNFRILALTATPSGKPEGVQQLIDNLHISHIEIRDEESIDLKKYVHKKNTELVLVKMTPNVIKLRDMLAKLMRPLIQALIQAGLLREFESDPSRIHPFRPHALRGEEMKKKNFKLVSVLTKLESYARAMQYLLEHSIGMFQESLTQSNAKKSSSSNKDSKKSSNSKDSADIALIVAAVEQMKAVGGFVPHAKMDRLMDLLQDHFSPRKDGDGKGDLDPKTTRVMVFCLYRQCVDELVNHLNMSPLIRAFGFVGQGTDTVGKKGLKQSEQLQAVKDFKSGTINVLVATSIGEEGLDIGAVDKIICYDAQKSSVRMLQRIGRTGRKRDGEIIVLMGEGREEDAWNKAKESYESVQHAITHGATLELYDDVPRLLPADCKPEVIFEVVPIDTASPEVISKATRRISGTSKPKEKATRGIALPKGAAVGFVKAGDLKASLKGGEPETHSVGDMPGMARSSSDAGHGRSADRKGKGRAVRSDSEEDVKKNPMKRSRTVSGISKLIKKRRVLNSCQDSEDSDASMEDLEELAGFRKASDIVFRPKLQSSSIKSHISSESLVIRQRGFAKSNRDSSHRVPSTFKIPSRVDPATKLKPYPSRPSNKLLPETFQSQPNTEDMSWVLGGEDDTEDDIDVEHADKDIDDGMQSTGDEDHCSVAKFKPKLIEVDDGDDDGGSDQLQQIASAFSLASKPRVFDKHMPSPQLSVSRTSSPLMNSPLPVSTYPVRRPGVRPRANIVCSSSSPEPQRQRDQTTKQLRHTKIIAHIPRDVAQYIQHDAMDSRSSGEDMSDDGSAVHDEPDEADLAFVGDFEATQAPREYNQYAAHMAGQFTQANPPSLKFTTNRYNAAKPYRRPEIRGSDSSLSLGSAADDIGRGYAEDSDDSFVAGDDEEVSFLDSSEV